MGENDNFATAAAFALRFGRQRCASCGAEMWVVVKRRFIFFGQRLVWTCLCCDPAENVIQGVNAW